MDDDNADWLSGAADEPAQAAPTLLGGKKKAAAAAAAAPAPGAAPPAAEEAPVDDRPVAEDEYLDPDKLILFKHWIRPKFLSYRYLFDYRRNYYDDVLDYLDKRNKGLHRDIPVAQTWPERVLRTVTSNRNRLIAFREQAEDIKLATKMHLSGTFYRYHSKEYINRKYSSLLY